MKKKVLAAILALIILTAFAACGKNTNGEIRIPIPEGFAHSPTQNLDEVYLCSDGSTITMMKSSQDPTLEDVTEESLTQALSNAYEKELGATVTPIEFSDDDIAGCPGYLFIYQIELDGQIFYQYQFSAQNEYLYTWTLSDITGTHAEEFVHCLDNVYLEK